MDLNSGKIIFLSSCYTHKEFQAPPISGVGGAIALNIAVLCLTLVAHFLGHEDMRLAVASNIGSVK